MEGNGQFQNLFHLTTFRHIIWAELDSSLLMLLYFHWIRSDQADLLRPGCLTSYSCVRLCEFHLDCMGKLGNDLIKKCFIMRISF